MRSSSHTTLFALFVLSSCAGSAPAAPPSVAPKAAEQGLAARAKALHAGAIVVDTHNDITSKIFDARVDLAASNPKNHTDIPRLRAGGITAEFFSIYVDADFTKPGAVGGGPARRALDLID